MFAYDVLPEFDAPAIAYVPAADSYYYRYNDPPEFLDVPGYRGNWQNLDSMERDRRVRIVNTPGCNGQNLDYAPDWYPTPQQAINFKESTDEEKAAIFGIKSGVTGTNHDLLPGDLVLRDQRWVGTFSGKAGDRLIDVTITDGTPEISDKYISTFVSQPLDTSFISAVYPTHVEVALYEYRSGFIAEIGGKSYTIFHYDRGKLYLIEGTSGIHVGQSINIYRQRTYIPYNDNDFDAFNSGSIFRCEGWSTQVLDHFPNARSIVEGKNGDPMCSFINGQPRYQPMDQHPSGEEYYYSRFLPEIWGQCGLPTTKVYLRQPLAADYNGEPFIIVNKQWYVASVEVIEDFPEGHEPECWDLLRIGGANTPYRFRRFLFKNWNPDDLPGDITYSYGKVNPPAVQETWFETIDDELYSAFPNWYQSLEPRKFHYDGIKINGYIPPGEWTSHGIVLSCDETHILFDRHISDSRVVAWKQWATLTRILTVPSKDFYNALGNFADLFVCNLSEHAINRPLPKVTSEGLSWETWPFQLYAAGIAYVSGEQ